ncbi:related to Ester hydrolase C11orf54 homolog [Cephalotrichum gorgonifer]|uniref:Related to Ester hydrolase C11orf54 homolog n=1 Tax=Cephalotrichum gorgonifer TaxID=2041049 RepID=A0AAE8MZ61_9PEZI|nr:related to Ester hydrolase C11orf54 homolog [Cephalotrichum gorgonifer]
METQIIALSPPSLEDLAEALRAPLEANFEHATISVVTCPDLRDAPFHLATQGLSGDEKIADVGGQPNLFPRPRLDCIWSMPDISRAMEMDEEKGSLLGAGAGPFHVVGQNCELAPNLSWSGGFGNVVNGTRVALIDRDTGGVSVDKTSSLDCALMVNLFGSSGDTGPVLKISTKSRTGPEKSFTECIRKALHAVYGASCMISLGGVVLVKSGRARYHVMPDFPSEQDLPFKERKDVDNWLTYHDFDGPIVCLSVLHSADPEALGLRMEHSHAFSPLGKNAGGHYHYDIGGDEVGVEYEAYFNTAKTLYRVDRPAT